MSHTDPAPEKAPDPSPDEMDRIQQMHQRMLDSQEAWRKLLENLDRVKKQRNSGIRPGSDDPKTEKPSE